MSENDTAPAREQRPKKKSFFARLVSIRPSDLIGVIVLCVIIGLVLAVFNVDPANLWVDFFDALGEAWQRFFEIIADSIGWAVQYFFLGAVIVVPIWIVYRLIKAASGKS